jgi:peroxiredoxin
MSFMRSTIILLCAALLLLATARAQTQTQEVHAHEYAPLREVALPIKDFTFKTLDDAPVNLRAVAQGKKLVLVHYFAAWCHSSNYDVETVNELYRKYKDQGLAVVAVCEYSKTGELRDFIKKHQPEYPICIESKSAKDRASTMHYAYRRAMEDKRNWGTPLNIFLLTSDLRSEGEFLTSRTRIVPGELVKTEIEEFIKQALKSEQ